MAPFSRVVIPAKAGIHDWVTGMPGMDSRLRGNDMRYSLRLSDATPDTRYPTPKFCLPYQTDETSVPRGDVAHGTLSRFVIPAKAGIHGWVTGMPGMDSRLRGNDRSG
jgi:hypothetical protein